jgi:hypothetical protein
MRIQIVSITACRPTHKVELEILRGPPADIGQTIIGRIRSVDYRTGCMDIEGEGMTVYARQTSEGLWRDDSTGVTYTIVRIRDRPED